MNKFLKVGFIVTISATIGYIVGTIVTAIHGLENLSFDKVLYRRLKQSEMQRGCKFNRKGERVQWLRNQYHHLRLYRAQTLLLKGFTENQDS